MISNEENFIFCPRNLPQRIVLSGVIYSFFLFSAVGQIPPSPLTAPAVAAPSDIEAPGIPGPAVSPATLGYNGEPDDPNLPVKVHVISPKPEEIITDSDVDLFFKVDNYHLAKGGNKLRVILNNNNPVPYDDLRIPLTLKNLPEGGHTVRVMAVRNDGRAFTNPEAFAMIHFYVHKKDFQNFVDPRSPYLTVNLPLNENLDLEEGARVWLDFVLRNATLSENGAYQIHYKMNNVETFLQTDEPVYWDGLQPGHYDLTIELVDKSRRRVPGLFNHVNRVFEIRSVLKATPVEPTTPPAPVEREGD